MIAKEWVRYRLRTHRLTLTLRETDRPTLGHPLEALPLIRALYARLDETVETFSALYCDVRGKPNAWNIISKGTISNTLVHPREVFAPAIRVHAAGLVLIHNHPSGDASPSEEDLNITERLVQVGELLGIRIVDHVVIGTGNDSYVSLGERGLIR